MSELKVALIGNPNSGKSSLFNQLTGLRQHVGNYPGVTVEKKTGYFTHDAVTCKLYDLPGTYSLYPNSADEEVVFNVLSDPQHSDYPDKVLVVTDLGNIRRGLLLFCQVQQLGLPVLLVLNMADEAVKKGIRVDVEELGRLLNTEIVVTNARKGEGMQDMKAKLTSVTVTSYHPFVVPEGMEEAVKSTMVFTGIQNPYLGWHLLAQKKNPVPARETELKKIRTAYNIIPRRLQVKESLIWYAWIDEVIRKVNRTEEQKHSGVTQKIDRWVLHPVMGYVIFLASLFLVFQAIFSWSSIPMDLIDRLFYTLSSYLSDVLPAGPLSDLFTQGVIPGIGGIVIFVPQIVVLFFFLLLMEESGYMSRVVFMMDRWMRPFGLNGKSMVPLMSGAACAVPAVMSARNIEHAKERLITILVTPFMTCSARLPVYSLLIYLIIPDKTWLGFNLRGLTLFGMYALGVVTALLAALVMKLILKSGYRSYLLMELPLYKVPHWKNVFSTLWKRTSAFVFGAGKIILAISIVLWVLASFGPGKDFARAEEIVKNIPGNTALEEEELALHVAAYKMEHSFLGIMGKAIEPAIRPLGYDWKIGIGILSSFAAREVFVPTMATIYSISYVGDDDMRLKERMMQEKNPVTGKLVFDFATGMSLLFFYAFAMQCMSTLAAVKRETKSWKWPLMQLIFMSLLAYGSAFILYQALT